MSRHSDQSSTLNSSFERDWIYFPINFGIVAIISWCQSSPSSSKSVRLGFNSQSESKPNLNGKLKPSKGTRQNACPESIATGFSVLTTTPSLSENSVSNSFTNRTVRVVVSSSSSESLTNFNCCVARFEKCTSSSKIIKLRGRLSPSWISTPLPVFSMVYSRSSIETFSSFRIPRTANLMGSKSSRSLRNVSIEVPKGLENRNTVSSLTSSSISTHSGEYRSFNSGLPVFFFLTSIQKLILRS